MFELCLFLLFASGLWAREVGTLFAFYGWISFIIFLLGVCFAWYFRNMCRRVQRKKNLRSRYSTHIKTIQEKEQ